MTQRRFIPWPDARLRRAAEPVSEITDEIRRLWDDMIETMDAMPGVGLAAPQIGVMHVHEEASPNLPGVSAKISRPRGVTVRFLDENGVITRRDFVGLEATSVQHQIDHLAGKMYFDNLSKVKRDMLLRKARKLNG